MYLALAGLHPSVHPPQTKPGCTITHQTVLPNPGRQPWPECLPLEGRSTLPDQRPQGTLMGPPEPRPRLSIYLCLLSSTQSVQVPGRPPWCPEVAWKGGSLGKVAEARALTCHLQVGPRKKRFFLSEKRRSNHLAVESEHTPWLHSLRQLI